jgi:tetratricopeptide (TPR) repeat protein
MVLCTRLASAAGASVDALWAQEGQTLRDLAAVTQGQERGEALLRLGEWERRSADRTRRRMDDDPAQAGSQEPVLRGHLDAAEKALSEAEDLASRDRLPQVLFSLGDLRRFRGDLKGDQRPLMRLLQEFPNHPLSVDAAIALGDDAFDAGKLAEAMKQYGFADAHAQTPGAHAYARYKLAWCDMNLDDYEATRSLLLQVIGLAETRQQKLTLADEARRDYVIALARDARVTGAQARASIEALRLAPDRTRRYEESYADIIAGSGRDKEAAQLFAAIEPQAPPEDAVHIFTAELEIAIRERDLTAATAAGRKLADTASAFTVKSAEAREAAEKAVRTAAVTLHGEGRARANDTMLTAALALYEDYFLAFDATPLSYDLHHHAGELLVLLHRPAEAERQYTAAVERDLARQKAHEPPGKWLQASALGAVNAAQDALRSDADPSVKQTVPTRATATDEDVDRPPPVETALASAEQTFVRACERYLQLLPGGADAVDVSYQRALTLYRHNRLNEAGDVLRHIALDHPEATPASTAAELAMEALRLQGRYDELARLTVALRDRHPIGEKLSAELSEVHEAALLAAAAREAKHGHEAIAANRYLEFVKQFPGSARLDKALYNAASALAAQGRVDEAIRARDRLLTSLPKSPLATRARERQLDDLVRLGRFGEAERIATRTASEAKGAAALAGLHDAIALAEAAGDTRTADALRTKYLREHPHGPDAMPAALVLAQHARGCPAQIEASRRVLAFASDAPGRTVALARLAEREDRCHNEGQARAHASDSVALATRLKAPDALDAAADAALVLTHEEMTKYRALTLAAPYERTVPRKIAALKALDEKLAKVVARGRANAAVCALVESGQAYGDLAQDLGKARAPSVLTNEQREMFREQLAEKAQPLFDHARQSLVEAVTRAREAGTAPACLADAQRSLAALWPERFGKQQEAVVRLLPTEEKPTAQAADILNRAPDAPAAWLIAARAELAGHHPEAAVILADRIQDKDFLFAEGMEVKARALELMNQTDAALALWVRLAREFPDRPLAHRVLADRALVSRDFEAARAHLTELWKRDKKDADVALNLGVVLHGLGDVAGAEEALRQARTLAPKRTEASLDLGLLLCGDGGRPAEGVTALEQFAQAGGHAPDGKGFAAALAACRALANPRATNMKGGAAP